MRSARDAGDPVGQVLAAGAWSRLRRHLARGGTVAAAFAALSVVAAPVERAGASPPLPTITLAMDGTSISVGGTLQSGGVDIRSTTTTEAQGAPMLFHLNPGVTATSVYAFLTSPAGQDPNNANRFGQIVVDAQAPRGVSHVQATLLHGDYIAFDTSRQNPAQWPHATFTVTAAASPVALPTPQATITAIEFGFRAPAVVHRGALVRFANGGFLVHMIAAIKAPNAATAQRIAGDLRAGQDGAAQHLATGFSGFAGPLSSHQFQQLKVGVQAGYWVLACFMDTQDHREHTTLGMERVIQVAP